MGVAGYISLGMQTPVRIVIFGVIKVLIQVPIECPNIFRCLGTGNIVRQGSLTQKNHTDISVKSAGSAFMVILVNYSKN